MFRILSLLLPESVQYDTLFMFVVPSPPWNVTVVQKNSNIAQVSWRKPRRPNGHIIEYHVFSTPPLPPLQTVVRPQDQSSTTGYAEISTHFEPGAQYSVWVNFNFKSIFNFKKCR